MVRTGAGLHQHSFTGAANPLYINAGDKLFAYVYLDPNNPPQFEPGDHRLGNKSFQPEEVAKLKPKLEKLKKRFGATTEDLASMALNYLLTFPRVACVIPGFRNDGHGDQ